MCNLRLNGNNATICVVERSIIATTVHIYILGQPTCFSIFLSGTKIQITKKREFRNSFTRANYFTMLLNWKANVGFPQYIQNSVYTLAFNSTVSNDPWQRPMLVFLPRSPVNKFYRHEKSDSHLRQNVIANLNDHNGWSTHLTCLSFFVDFTKTRPFTKFFVRIDTNQWNLMFIT